MQFAGQPKPPVGVIFDSDLGSHIDTALALALLYGFDGKNEARVVALSVTRSNLSAAAFCDSIGRFYAGAVNAGFGFAARTLPVGLATDRKIQDETPMVAKTLAMVKPDGTPLHPHGVQQFNDTADPAAVIRNALTGQYDQNAMVVLAGPASNLARTMMLPGVKELIERKVRYLVVSAGAFAEGAGIDPRIAMDVPAARRLFAEWPTPIFAVGAEMAASVRYPAASIEKDFAWATGHPVVDAYRAAGEMPYDAPTRDMEAVLYAVRPKENFFKLSEPGTISVHDDGRTRFAASGAGKHRYLVFDPEQKEDILKVFTEVASAKPVVRQRFRPPKVEEKK